MLVVGAVWNWSVALLLTTLAALELGALSWFLNGIPESLLWFYLFMGIGAVFGIGYYWVASDVRRNRNIIKMGILGKTLVFVLIIHGWEARPCNTSPGPSSVIGP